LYELARKGEDVPALERTVTIHCAELIEHSGDTADVRIDCSSGTYIRALAEALGEALGCGAHMCGLRREAVGRWPVEDAWSLDAIEEIKRTGNDLPAPLPIERCLDYPKIEITSQARESVVHGLPIGAGGVVAIEDRFERDDIILVVDDSQEVLAIATALVGSDQRPDWPANQAVLRYRRVLIQ
jgi:tRNA pseudouridine55 synthase